MTLTITMSALCTAGYIYSGLLLLFNIRYRNLRLVYCFHGNLVKFGEHSSDIDVTP